MFVWECFASLIFLDKITHYASLFLIVHPHQLKWYKMLPKASARASTLELNKTRWPVDAVKEILFEKINLSMII